MLIFKLYKDRRGEWRWRLLSRNGRIVATSGEGYKRRGAALKMIRWILEGGASDDFVVEAEGKQ